MTLSERIVKDLTSAMKSGQKTRLETLRTLRAALMEREIEKRGSGEPMTPDDEVAVLMNAAKKRRESIEMFGKGGRTDLVEQEGMELEIISEYLPTMMTPDEIQTVITAVISEVGASSPGDFGKVMPLVMKQVKGKADGKTVQELVRKNLG